MAQLNEGRGNGFFLSSTSEEIHGNMASHNSSPIGTSEELRRDGMMKDREQTSPVSTKSVASLDLPGSFPVATQLVFWFLEEKEDPSS